VEEHQETNPTSAVVSGRFHLRLLPASSYAYVRVQVYLFTYNSFGSIDGIDWKEKVQKYSAKGNGDGIDRYLFALHCVPFRSVATRFVTFFLCVVGGACRPAGCASPVTIRWRIRCVQRATGPRRPFALSRSQLPDNIRC
jgi:hypothetical protein